jgi:hypothetical protein
MTVSRTFSLTLAAATAPSWFTQMSHKQWAQPVTNTIQSVLDPLATTTNHGASYGSGILTAWTGGICDETRKTIGLVGNGGHLDYFGNEVYSVDLSQPLTATTPRWTLRRNANPAEGDGSSNYFAWPSNNMPPSDHTGFYCVAAEGNWYKLGLGATNYNGGTTGAYWWRFNPATNQYAYLGNTFPSSGSYPITRSSLFDPVRRELITISKEVGPGVSFHNIDTFAQTRTINTVLGYGVNAAIDTTNRIVLLSYDSTPWTYAFFRLDNIAAGITSLTVTGTTPVVLEGSGPSDSFGRMKLWWHAPSNAFVTWDGSQGLMKLTPTVSGGSYTTAAWSSVAGAGAYAGSIVPPSNMVTAISGGMYSKVSLISDMGDGTAALVIVPRWVTAAQAASGAKDVWVMRLTGAV